MDKLRTICSRQEKAPADIIVLCQKWNVDDDQVEVVLEQLTKEKYLDESRFAHAFVTDKIRFDHWGIVKIKIMLGRKGISKANIEKAIRDIDRAEYRKIISGELAKKRRSLKGTPYEKRARLLRFGLSKGFEMHDMEDLLGEEQEPSIEW